VPQAEDNETSSRLFWPFRANDVSKRPLETLWEIASLREELSLTVVSGENHFDRGANARGSRRFCVELAPLPMFGTVRSSTRVVPPAAHAGKTKPGGIKLLATVVAGTLAAA